jgi:hypothetical protein
MAADLSVCGLEFQVLSTHRFDSLEERLVERTSLGAVALVCALPVVEGKVHIEVSLQLFQRFVEGLCGTQRRKIPLSPRDGSVFRSR